MSEHEFELREVVHEPPRAEGDRLQESVVGDVAASVSAVVGVGGLSYAAAAFHSRVRSDEAEARHEAEMAALRAEMNAGMRVLRAEMEAEMRDLRAQGYGFGPDDDYPFGGFGVE
jgi:hypothetical protein